MGAQHIHVTSFMFFLLKMVTFPHLATNVAVPIQRIVGLSYLKENNYLLQNNNYSCIIITPFTLGGGMVRCKGGGLFFLLY